MDIRDVLTLPCTCVNVQGKSKKRILELATDIIERHNATIRGGELFSALLTREKLGSTAIGNGIALPHCQISSCTMSVGAFFKLASPVDFDAIDQKMVDLVFILVAPVGAEEENINLLRDISLQLRDLDVQKRLRQCVDNQSLYNALTTQCEVKY